MLTLYPNTGWDSFTTVATATENLTNLVPDITAWSDLDEPSQEVYIRQATLLMKQRLQTLPETLESDLELACAYLANHSIDKDMTNEDESGNVKEEDIDGLIKTVYFSPNKESNSLPSIVESLLSKYDQKSSGGFSTRRA